MTIATPVRYEDDDIFRAKMLYEIYERLAPQFSYETRPDTKDFNAESPNGQLMIAAVSEFTKAEFGRLTAEVQRLKDELAKYEAMMERVHRIDTADGVLLKKGSE